MNQRDSSVRLPSWLIAASLVVVIVATLTYFITTSNDNTDEAAPQAEPTKTSDPTENEPASDDAQDTKSDDGKGSDKAAEGDKSTKSGQDDKSDAKSEQKKPEKKKAPEPTADATVDVYNNSGITNLAASASGDVQSAGFSIGGVDNWYGAIPSTTVYYPPGMEDQAKLLADSLGVGRILPAVKPMSGDRLSLILTAAI